MVMIPKIRINGPSFALFYDIIVQKNIFLLFIYIYIGLIIILVV